MTTGTPSETPAGHTSYWGQYPLFRGFAGGAFIAGIACVLVSAAIRLFVAPPPGATTADIIFFSHIPSEVAQAAAKGHIDFSTYVTQPLFWGAFLFLYAIFLLMSAFSMMVPLKSERPFSLQVSLAGFFWGLLATLFLYRQFHLNHELIFAIMRVLWIALIYWFVERLKAAYPEKWIGKDYFPSLADGLFAIAATLIVQRQLNQNYDDVTSGPVFLIVAFVVITFIGRAHRRRLMKRVLMNYDVEIPEDTERTFKSAAPAVAGAFFSRLKQLNAMSTEEMEVAYAKMKVEISAPEVTKYLREGDFGFTMSMAALLFFWAFAVLVMIWVGFNINLYYLG